MSETSKQQETVKSKSKSTLRTFLILCAVLVLLIGILVAVYFIAKSNDEEESRFDIWEGESSVGNAAHLAYPMIENEDVLKIEIENESGSFTFSEVWDEASADYVWRIEEYKDIAINQSGFEMLRMNLCTAITYDPMRNVSENDLVEWGVDDSCKTSYTLHYKDNGVEKSYTVRIGKRANLSSETYCAYIEGRNHIYKFPADACSYVTRSSLSYLSPMINTFFENETYALLGIDNFEIYLEKNNSLKSVVKINVKERDESAVSFDAVYSKDVLGKDRTTIASPSYLTTVFSTLYVAFSGSEVVAIEPDEATLSEYGLGDSDEKYLIDATFANSATFASPSYKQKEPQLFISREIDGSYYVLSKYFSKIMIVEVSKDTLPFLGEDSYSLIKWTDTTSITTGFFETLCKDTETEAPGLDKIVIKALKEKTELDDGTVLKSFNEEIFDLHYDEAEDILLVKALNSQLEFKDNNNADSSERNYFRNLYVYFLYYPFINDFNTMTAEEMAEYEKEDNIVYSITAYRNDGKVVRYTYYEIDVNFAFEKAESGKLNADGTVTWDEPIYDYISSMTHLRKVYLAIDKLLSGEKVTPDDELL